jgi:putative addiction module antidote
MFTTKITKVGNSSAMIIPREIMDKMNLRQGDQLYLHVDKQTIQVSACDPDFVADMALADEIMREDREVLNQLAQ